VKAPIFVPTPHRLLPTLTPRAEIALLARVLVRAGYDDNLAGHITYRQEDGTMLCSPWLLHWSEIYPHDIITIDMDGQRLGGEWPVPAGIPLHVELHRARSVKIALHNHPRWATVWANMGQVPPALDQSSIKGGGRLVVVEEYAGAVNETESARLVIESIGDADCALLAHHGVLVTGDSIRSVHLRSVALEIRSRSAWLARALGTPTEISPALQERAHTIPAELYEGYWEAMARQELIADPHFAAAICGES